MGGYDSVSIVETVQNNLTNAFRTHNFSCKIKPFKSQNQPWKNLYLNKVHKCGSLYSICWLCAYLCQYYWRSVLFWLRGNWPCSSSKPPFIVIIIINDYDYIWPIAYLSIWPKVFLCISFCIFMFNYWICLLCRGYYWPKVLWECHCVTHQEIRQLSWEFRCKAGLWRWWSCFCWWWFWWW